MNKLRIAFDVDDTLIIPNVALREKDGGYDRLGPDIPNYDNIAIYKWFQSQGYEMVIWSGGGIDYANMWAEKLGLNPDMVIEKKKDGNNVDIAFDDCDVDLAKVNIKVKRVNNSIDRREWNDHKSFNN